MKILYHFRVRGTGAEGVHIAGIAGAFQDLGHQVEFVSPTGVNPLQVLSAQPAEPVPASSFTVRLLHRLADHLPQPAFELMELAYSRLAQLGLEKAIAIHRPDMIYERYAFFNLAGAQAATHRRIPLVLEVNELSGLDRVRGQCFIRMAQAREAHVFRQAAVLTPVSPFLARRAAQIRGTNAGVLTVPNGVGREWVKRPISDQDRSSMRQRLGLPVDSLVLGFIGGLVPWHGFDFLFDVFTRLCVEIPNLYLVLVGNGPLMSELKAASQTPAMKGRLLLPGAMPYRQTRVCLDLFDVAVIPQANEFRSPIKLFEYMGAGRAIVAPATEPIASVVRHGEDALLFKPLDQTEGLDALRQALQKPELRQRLGANARRKALESCLWEHRAKAVLDAVGDQGRQ